jgi:hypothetical protein
MATRTLAADTMLRFGTSDHPGLLRLRVFLLGFDRPAVAILTELPTPGPSVSNHVGAIAEDVARDFGIDADAVLWVEHMMPISGCPEEWWAIGFQRGDHGRLVLPEWRPITRRSIETVIGGPLAP